MNRPPPHGQQQDTRERGVQTPANGIGAAALQEAI